MPVGPSYILFKEPGVHNGPTHCFCPLGLPARYDWEVIVKLVLISHACRHTPSAVPRAVTKASYIRREARLDADCSTIAVVPQHLSESPDVPCYESSPCRRSLGSLRIELHDGGAMLVCDGFIHAGQQEVRHCWRQTIRPFYFTCARVVPYCFSISCHPVGFVFLCGNGGSCTWQGYDGQSSISRGLQFHGYSQRRGRRSKVSQRDLSIRTILPRTCQL